jgi:hypothetical protein
VLLLTGCIEKYWPEIEAIESNKYVVYGELTAGPEEQVISVAIASSVSDPGLIPLNDCQVGIKDTHENSYRGMESGDGMYSVRIPPEALVPGTGYRLEIRTPAGVNLVSGYEELIESPDIDTVYYLRETMPTNDPETFIEGIRFYIDLDASGETNTFYRFELEETFEYHAWLPLEWYYDGELHHVEPPDWSHYKCWATHPIRDIFTLNTAELQRNEYRQFPLHFVDNRTQRLEHLYSLLVRQYSISKHAYVFWDQLRANNMERGGLYETQPLPAKGNLVNLTNPQQPVLGYFQVSNVKTKRIFVKDVPGLEMDYIPSCMRWPLLEPLRFFRPDQYPVYLTGRYGLSEVSADCIFCELSVLGGTTEKPDFWPE